MKSLYILLHVEDLVENVPFILGPLSQDLQWRSGIYDDWPEPLIDGWRQFCLRDRFVLKNFNQYLDKIAFVRGSSPKGGVINDHGVFVI